MGTAEDLENICCVRIFEITKMMSQWHECRSGARIFVLQSSNMATQVYVDARTLEKTRWSELIVAKNTFIIRKMTFERH